MDSAARTPPPAPPDAAARIPVRPGPHRPEPDAVDPTCSVAL
ncbi:hypothetical protein [Streptomyces sp. NPDC056361]